MEYWSRLMKENTIKKRKELVELGTEITGSTIGNAVSLLIPGPTGAVGGALISPVITQSLKIITDFAFRDLSKREKIKAGAGLNYAYSKIIQYLEEERKPREDGFFERDITGRSASDEILEGTLLKCKNEHEEKKLKLIGNIYANVAFMPEVKMAGANWLLQECQELTYRQLCIIAIIKQSENKSVSWGPQDGDPAFEIEYTRIDYMLARDYSPDSVRSYEETGEGLWVTGLSRIGEFCFEVMGLHEIPSQDLLALKSHFCRAFE
jgi:hypothetical protein